MLLVAAFEQPKPSARDLDLVGAVAGVEKQQELLCRLRAGPLEESQVDQTVWQVMRLQERADGDGEKEWLRIVRDGPLHASWRQPLLMLGAHQVSGPSGNSWVLDLDRVLVALREQLNPKSR